MSSKLSSNVMQGLGNFLQDNQVSFVNGILVVITLGSEQAFRLAAFNCPCNQPNALVYGLSFLVGPAFVLLVLGILMNNVTWRLCQGCAHRSSSANHGCLESSRNCAVICGRAIVVPSAWIFVALLDGNYYVCLVSSSPCESGLESNRNLIATSQVISWIFLAVLVSVASASMTYARCKDSVTFHHGWFVSIYRDAERQRLEEVMKEKASQLADKNIKLFFEEKSLKKKDWDFISMAPMQHVECYTLDESSSAEQCYSPLHKWAKEHEETS